MQGWIVKLSGNERGSSPALCALDQHYIPAPPERTSSRKSAGNGLPVIRTRFSVRRSRFGGLGLRFGVRDSDFCLLSSIFYLLFFSLASETGEQRLSFRYLPKQRGAKVKQSIGRKDCHSSYQRSSRQPRFERISKRCGGCSRTPKLEQALYSNRE